MFGPLATWEVTRALRRSGFFWLRSGYVALLGFMFVWYAGIYTKPGFWNQSDLAEFADRYLRAFSYVQLIAILVMTTASIAPAIASERRQRTLEYLIVSLLSDREIVLGKWAGRVFVSLSMIVAGVPLLALTMLLGGVDLTRAASVVAVTAACAGSYGALVLLLSVYSNSERQAIFRAIVLVSAILIAPSLLSALAGLAVTFREPGLGAVLRWTIPLVEVIHPFTAISELLDTTKSGFWAVAGPRLLIHAAFALICIALSVNRLRPVAIAKLSDPFETARWLRARRSRVIPAVGDKPIHWKEWHFDAQQGRLWRIATLCVLIVVIALPFLQGITSSSWGWAIDERAMQTTMRWTYTVLLCLTYFQLAVRAATSVGIERDQDCWASLLASPITGHDIVMGKMLEAMKPLIWLTGVMLPACLLAAMLGAISIASVPILLLSSFNFGYFACCVGIAKGHLHKSTNRGITESVAFIGANWLIGVFAAGMSPVVVLPLAMFSAQDLSGAATARIWFLPMFSIAGSWLIFFIFGRVELRRVIAEFDQRRISFGFVAPSKTMIWRESPVHEA